jgi:signal transduction histidine kinase
VCTQNAKTCVSGVEQTLSLLDGPAPVAALIAPSYLAEFSENEPERVVGALRSVGFRYVIEVARGADRVSAAYEKLLRDNPEGSWIATACPAIIERVRKYHPELVPRLAPIASPMVAAALETRNIYGQEVHCVFIGPCIAKKIEARDPLLPRAVEEALTFTEVRRIFAQRGIDPAQAEPSELDPPLAGTGRAFPLIGGLLISAGLQDDPLDNRFVVATGRRETDSVLCDMEHEGIRPRLVEALMCHGCHEGPGMSRVDTSHRRRAKICAHVPRVRPTEFAECMIEDLARTFETDDRRLVEPSEEDIRMVLSRTNKFSVEDELNCGACGYPTCRAKASAVVNGLAEEAMCLPFLIDQAERVCNELHVPWRDLREVHRQLVSTEKLASLGQLAAGIAHELNNPLGTILLYAGLIERKLGGAEVVSKDIDLVQRETQRCKRIVAGLLDFARQNRVRFSLCRLNDFAAEVIEKSFNAAALTPRNIFLHLYTESESIDADIDRDQMMQVLVNLVQNGIEALGDRGGNVTVSLSRSEDRNRVRIAVRDDGCGIPPEDHDRVFQPFFTTKSIGRGTGLGLAITYGIVKMHHGTIWFESTPGNGATFFIELPISQARQTRSMTP